VSARHVVLTPFASVADGSLLREVLRTEVRGNRCASPWQLPRTRRWLRAQLTELAPVVVHAHLFHGAVLTATMPRAVRARTVLTHHHGSLLSDQGRRFDAILDRWATARFGRLVAVSHQARGFLEQEYRIGRPIDVVPNGWSGSPVLAPEDHDTLTFLCVGNFRREKGHVVLLAAFAQVQAVFPTARLVLLGDGPLRSEIEAQVAVLGLRDVVELVGWRRDVWPFYADADVVVVPSLVEPQGIVVLEAMASGTAVVATNVGGIPEMIEDDVTGILVAPDDEDALADALLSLARSPELRASAARLGAEAAEAWRMERTVQRYDEIYREVLSGVRG
jgi:glycosyltransferase involved in cell wall biosynthesis